MQKFYEKSVENDFCNWCLFDAKKDFAGRGEWNKYQWVIKLAYFFFFFSIYAIKYVKITVKNRPRGRYFWRKGFWWGDYDFNIAVNNSDHPNGEPTKWKHYWEIWKNMGVKLKNIWENLKKCEGEVSRCAASKPHVVANDQTSSAAETIKSILFLVWACLPVWMFV